MSWLPQIKHIICCITVAQLFHETHCAFRICCTTVALLLHNCCTKHSVLQATVAQQNIDFSLGESLHFRWSSDSFSLTLNTTNHVSVQVLRMWSYLVPNYHLQLRSRDSHPLLEM